MGLYVTVWPPKLGGDEVVRLKNLAVRLASTKRIYLRGIHRLMRRLSRDTLLTSDVPGLRALSDFSTTIQVAEKLIVLQCPVTL
eukprot:20157-Pleurochrysis_carterae.AAC.1